GQGHAQAHPDIDIGDAIEAPAKAADEIDHRIEQRDLLPEFGQHRDRVEAAAEKGQRGDDQRRHDRQLFPAVRPYDDDEAEQAERHRGQNEEGNHPDRMLDGEADEEPSGDQDDETEQYGFGGGRTDIAGDDLDH